LGRLAAHYQQEGSYNLAEATYRKAIAVAENHIPNPLIAPVVYYQFGRLLELEGENEEAEAAYKHAFDALENMQGRFRPVAIGRLSDTPLVQLYEKEGRTSEAEAILERALAAQELALDQHDEHLARTLVQLAGLKMREGEYSEAEPLCERALKIQEDDYGPDNPQLMQMLSLYASVERHLHNTGKADALAARAATLRKKLAVPR
jgi:tetratricopeptide (TPR) repeat protein